jgi:hypothetical protein
MKKPLIPENMKDGDDVRNVYNPDKQPNPWHNYDKKNKTNATVLATEDPSTQLK